MSIKKGDKVKVLTGKDKGKTGIVIKSLPKENKAVVDGLNVYKKHQRPRKQGAKGQILNMSFPIHISNLKKEDTNKTKKA